MTKHVNKAYIQFIGNASSDVTGSAYRVKFGSSDVLLECGMIQDGRDIYSLYQANKRFMDSFYIKGLTCSIAPHGNHNDHMGLYPALFHKGYKGSVFIPEGNKKFLEIMWADSLKIMESDSIKIEKKWNKPAPPLFNEKDIATALEHLIEIPYNYPIHLSDELIFEFLPSGHIINSASVLMTLKNSRGDTKRIYYSSDIGAAINHHYVIPRQTPRQFDIGIVENTYNSPMRPNNPKDTINDIRKIKSIVNDYQCTIFPSFALARSQEILTTLYVMWERGELPKDIKIYYDTPLGKKLSDIYTDDELWQRVWAWENVIKIDSFEDSLMYQMQNDKWCVIASSGMMNAGRVVSWIKSKLPLITTHICFIGYTPEEGLAADIKSCAKRVEIDGQKVKNMANYTELRSFSSHCDYKGLLDFYSSLQCNRLLLVHGNQDDKVEFAKVLQDKFVKQGQSTRVSAVQQGDKIFF